MPLDVMSCFLTGSFKILFVFDFDNLIIMCLSVDFSSSSEWASLGFVNLGVLLLPRFRTIIAIISLMKFLSRVLSEYWAYPLIQWSVDHQPTPQAEGESLE